jgi:flagellar biosynthesis protein FlhB
MDPTKLRMRYLVGILVAAVVAAGALCHFLHVEAGFSREEIRSGILTLSPSAYFSQLFSSDGGAVCERLSFPAEVGLIVFQHYRDTRTMLSTDKRH